MINIDLCLGIVISVVVSARPVTQMHPEKVIEKWTGERGVLVSSETFRQNIPRG
jgi:hypothetical protein